MGGPRQSAGRCLEFRMMRGLPLGAAFLFCLVPFGACAHSTHDGDGAHPDGGGDDSSVITGGQCPSDTLPTDNPCAINEKFGLFVSSSRGSPAGDGSMARPFPSVQQAIDAAKASKLRNPSASDVLTVAPVVARLPKAGRMPRWEPQLFDPRRAVALSAKEALARVRNCPLNFAFEAPS